MSILARKKEGKARGTGGAAREYAILTITGLITYDYRLSGDGSGSLKWCRQ
jgi:hypothetical protein